MSRGVKIDLWPGGVRTSSGGTRTAIQPNRFWSPPLFEGMIPKCPFDVPDELVLRQVAEENDWRVRQNRWTPYPFHRIIYPPTCWSVERLYELGGVAERERAIRVAAEEMPTEGPVWLFTHIGKLAGQNYPHLHYHLLQPIPQEGIAYDAAGVSGYVGRAERDREIMLHKGFRVVAGGHRGGQCFIAPMNPVPVTTPGLPHLIADAFQTITFLAAKAFAVETPGGPVPPHYMVGMWFQKKSFCFGVYVPILNHWGATECFGLLSGAPLTLPWSHEATAEHLRNFL